MRTPVALTQETTRSNLGISEVLDKKKKKRRTRLKRVWIRVCKSLNATVRDGFYPTIKKT